MKLCSLPDTAHCVIGMFQISQDQIKNFVCIRMVCVAQGLMVLTILLFADCEPLFDIIYCEDVSIKTSQLKARFGFTEGEI